MQALIPSMEEARVPSKSKIMSLIRMLIILAPRGPPPTCSIYKLMCNDGVVERIREVINWCDVCLNDAEEQVIHQLWWMTQTGATDGSKRFRLRDSETKEQRK